ncbi:MAG: GHKL domain-containing protein [Bacteroidetes bacterium]|nr:GHKL domain-containing protein [Bacteroidota bacterium]
MQFFRIIGQFLSNRFSKLILATTAFAAAYLLTLSVSENSSEPTVESFEKTLHAKEAAMRTELDSLVKLAQGKSFDDIFRERPPRYNSLYNDRGFVLYIYFGDSLKFWSDNSVSVENLMKDVCLDDRIVKLKNGWFDTQNRTDKQGRTYIGLIRLKNEYSYENQYLVNSFEKDFQLPPESSIATGTPGSSNAVKGSDGKYLFSLVFKSQGPPETPLWQLGLNIAFNVIGFILLLFFLDRESKELENSIGKNGSFLIFVASLVLLRFLSIRIHFPSSFYDLALFGPKDYGDAESFWNSNLGDFIINAVLLLFICVKFTKHLRKVSFPKTMKPVNRIILGLLLLCVPSFCTWAINGMIIGLVKNSDISFNVNDLFGLNRYSYTGFGLIAILLSGFFIVVDRCVRVFQHLFISPATRWNIFIAAALLQAGVLHLFGNVDLIADMWPYAVILILMLWRKDPDETTYTFSLIVFLVFIFAFYTTHMLLKESMHKEHDSRELFAEKIAAEQDPIGEHLFTEFENKLAHDTALIRLSQPPGADFSLFEKRVKQQYFSGYWDRYETKVSFFDTMCTPMLKGNGVLSDNITKYDELIEKFGVPTFSQNFYYLNSTSGRISYLVKLILQEPGHESFLGRGTLIVELDSKLMSEEIGFPELLLDRELGINQKLQNYSYAKYKNGQLVGHSGKFQYSLAQDQFGKDNALNKFHEIDGWCHLVHRPDKETVVILSKPDEDWLNVTTSFSYIFAIFSLLLIAALSLRQILTVGFTFSNLSFKYRIQLVLVIIVLVSLALFGGGSIYYIKQQYQAKNSEIIEEKGHSVILEVEEKLADTKLRDNYRDYATYVLKILSNTFFTDINLFDVKGNLYATSRPKIYDEGLTGRKMNPEAYTQLSIRKQSEFIHDENIGNLAYLSAYFPLKDGNGNVQAYINLPYFAKQSDLQKEISSFLVALINVYVFLFALSVLAAIFISNYLTHPLRLIQDKMRQVKLGRKSDQIEWKNKDEIGSLVSEYNRMIMELATSAELLAQSERESAWREMAKQVAHEIKNPLTPMRLSIQLLERAYRDKAPDIDQKVERLTKTMLEQIDTLSSIAGAFSDFAKMPKPSNEEMDLRSLVKNAIDLFHETSERTDFTFKDNGINTAIIFADKEQLLRVFNNLFRNAIQAIPEDRKGKIEVTLSRHGKNFIVAVKDNGHGIADEVLDKIFVPNFTTKTTGMGLGLAMVKNIVESCNGTIWFETAKDKGTTFSVGFPEYVNE